MSLMFAISSNYVSDVSLLKPARIELEGNVYFTLYWFDRTDLMKSAIEYHSKDRCDIMHHPTLNLQDEFESYLDSENEDNTSYKFKECTYMLNAFEHIFKKMHKVWKEYCQGKTDDEITIDPKIFLIAEENVNMALNSYLTKAFKSKQMDWSCTNLLRAYSIPNLTAFERIVKVGLNIETFYVTDPIAVAAAACIIHRNQ